MSESPIQGSSGLTSEDVRRAIGLYLEIAYERGAAPVPRAVVDRLAQLDLSKGDEAVFFASKAFERLPAGQPPAGRLSLRLGNRRYPHMKLVIDPLPAGAGHCFRADCHDRALQVPASASDAERAALSELTEFNRRIGDAIESSWEEGGVMTFRRYLKLDLAARRDAAAGRES